MPFWIVPLGFVLALIIFFAYMMAKAEIAMINHMTIIYAITHYSVDRIMANDLKHVNDVQTKDMEDFRQTVYRLTDWGYKRILPKEKYELVKPFINRKEVMKEYLKSKKKKQS